jgi:hypothetical protein
MKKKDNGYKMYSLLMPPVLHKLGQALALSKDMSLSALIRSLLKAALLVEKSCKKTI